MAVELATAWVSLVPSTKGIGNQVRSQMQGPLEQEGERAGNSMADKFSGVAAKGMKAAGVGALAAFGGSLVAGFGRLQAIDDARFKLQGLGHDADAVDAIMENALGSVRGTAFGLGDAATIAAAAVASGIEPGDELERTLSLTGDAATIAGTSLNDMGSIFGKVAASNRMMTGEMNQLQDRGLPVLSWLQDEYGVTAEAAREMVSNGEVDFNTFQRIIEDNIGGAALTAGASFRGSLANMGAAVGRFGAAILGPAFAGAPAVFVSLTDTVDRLTERVEPLGQFMAANATAFGIAAGMMAAVFIPVLAQVVVGWVTSAAAAVASAASQVAASWRVVGGWVAKGAAALVSGAQTAYVWALMQADAIKGAARHVASAARVVGGWVLMGVQSMIQGARMAAAWVLAMGPVGWVIAAVVALTALIIANWDTIVDWTRKAWTWVTDKIGDAWTWVRNTTSTAVSAVVDFFGNLRDRAVSAVTTLRDRVVGFFTDLRDQAVARAADLLATVVSRVVSLRDTVVSTVTNLRDRAVDLFTGLKDSAIERIVTLIARVSQIKDDVLGFFSGAKTWLLQAGKNIIQGLIDGIGDMVGAVGTAVNTVVSSVTDRLPWSPAKKGPLRAKPPEKGGRNIVSLMAAGMGDGLPALAAAADAAARAAMPTVGTVTVPRSPTAMRAFDGPADGVMDGGRHYHLTVNSTASETNLAEQFRRMEQLHG